MVTALDDDSENSGHRLFKVEFSDGDEAWLGVDDVAVSYTHLTLPTTPYV